MTPEHGRSLGLECRLVPGKAIQLMNHAVEQTRPSTVDLAVQPWYRSATSGNPLALGQVVELGNRPRSPEREPPVGPGVAAQLRNRARVVRGLGCDDHLRNACAER